MRIVYCTPISPRALPAPELTLSAAPAVFLCRLCASIADCQGFTFINNTATYRSAGGDPTFDIFLKSAVVASPDAGWSSYILVKPQLLFATYMDHMVLQASNPCLSGYGAAAGDSVAVVSSSDNAVRTGVVGPDLTWRVCLAAPQPPGGPYTINVTTALGSTLLQDVLFGEVWVASGQSNMAFGTQQAFNATAECAAASWPQLRVMTVAQLTSNVSLRDFGPGGIRQAWTAATPDSICGGGDFDYFTAVGYFYGRALQQRLAVPVGVIATTVPGTAIELWSSAEAMAQCNSSTGAGQRAAAVSVPPYAPAGPWHIARSLSASASGSLSLTDDSSLYNAMISPLLNVAIRGAIWYQGESNVGMPSYACRFPALINDWRAKWTATSGTPPAFPFLFVQLSPYYYSTPPPCLDGGNGAADPGLLPLQRIVQTGALSLPAVGMASAIDIGDAASPYWPGSVHPRNKRVVAERLALEARRMVYGESGLLSRGPQLASVALAPDDRDHEGSYHSKDSTTLALTFTSVGDGLAVTSLAQVAFVATYNDSTRVPASILPTNMTADTLCVYLTPAFGSEQLYPVSIDALWFDFPVVPVYNSGGLPLEPFRINLNSTALKLAKMGAAMGAALGAGAELARDGQGRPLLWQAPGQ